MSNSKENITSTSSTRQYVIDKMKSMKVNVNGKIDLAISSLLNEKPIYGYVFQKMVRQQSNHILTMGVTKDKQSRIVLMYNKNFVKENEVYLLHVVLEHEAQHVLRRHIDRAMNRNPNAWNIAADLSVNSELDERYLKDIVVMGQKTGCLHPKWHTNPTFVESEYKMSSDWFYEKVKNECEQKDGKGCKCPACGGSGKQGGGAGENSSDNPGENGEGGGSSCGEEDGKECPVCGGSGKISNSNGTLDDHDGWKEIANDAIAKNNMAEIAKSAINKAMQRKGGPGVSGSLLEEILKANKPKINWKKSLRWFLKKSIYKQHNFTRTRANRRLGWNAPGTKKEYATDLVLAIDTSGSIRNEELGQFIAEMNKIVEEVGNLTIIEFDSQVRKVTRNVTKVGGKWNFAGRGGTVFNSFLEWLRDNRADAAVVLTDLYPCDSDLINPKCQILFVGTPNSAEDFNPGFGRVVRMESGIE